MIRSQRRHLNEFQKSELATELLDVEQDLAKERMVKAHASPGHLTGAEKGDSREKTAEQVGLSAKTFERAVKIIEKGSDGLKDLVRNQTLSIYGGCRLGND